MQQRGRCQLSPRLKRKKRIVLFLFLFYVFSIILIVFFGSSLVLNSDFLSIKKINIIGLNSEDVLKIKDIISREMSKNFAGLFYKDNFLLIGKNNIINIIKESFPEVKNINLSLANLNSVDVIFERRNFFANWCNDDLKICYPIDDTGFSYKDDMLNISSSTISIITINNNPLIGKFIKKDPFIKKIKEYVKVFEDSNRITKILVNNNDEYFITLQNGVLIKVGSLNKPDEVLNNLNSIKADNKDFGLSNIDYIDFRYGKKIFLKKK